MSELPAIVDRRVIREELEKRRKYWVREDGTASTGALADEVLRVLRVRYDISCCDSDWS